MSDLKIRLLPPVAIGRFGSSEKPVENFTLGDDPHDPLGYRKILPEPTFEVAADGSLSQSTPEKITFRDGEHIRPVAPFLEVFTHDGDTLRPLCIDDLPDGAEVSWTVEVANHKVFRRTNDPRDKVTFKGTCKGHDPLILRGKAPNFTPDGSIDFGRVRYIRPTKEFPQIRARFTPGAGLIYGPVAEEGKDITDGDVVSADQRIYAKGNWVGFDADDNAFKDLGYYNETLPPSLYAISSPAPSWLNNNIAVSRGYFDDSCDGFITVKISAADGSRLAESTARICAGPPDIAPDAMFLRTLTDDLEQVLEGPGLAGDEAPEMTRARAIDIVRRAFETVRFMNLTVMNGNDFKGRSALTLDSMPQEESADTERALRPVMPPQTVDTLAISQLHAQVYAALKGGSEAWFANVIRRPDEVSDFTDHGRRKMPAMMCGADNGYLALTHRQIATIERAASLLGYSNAQPEPLPASDDKPLLQPKNRTAMISYKPQGNPISSTPSSSVANCCPGLEMDFRAVWRRLFKGVTLREYDNLVVTCDASLDFDLTGHRLMAVRLGKEYIQFTAPIVGPAPSDPKNMILQTTDMNPAGRAPLEWSNALAPVIAGYQGKTVRCIFTRERAKEYQVFTPGDRSNQIVMELEVRHFFDDGDQSDIGVDESVLISRALADAGELTQGLCSPWQNDYRECSCYYWASARPDFVNAEMGPDGLSSGDNWLQRRRTGDYVPDDYVDSRLINYDDLFRHWEVLLRFQISGCDAPGESQDGK
ncbi:hypothetical protein [Roseobacter sp.]|uniref:hypothetical protein n=1 Tax=Roseobacter sp. TaxID=1907202 RepID=UPI0025F323DE|nr:hypothetical protein [Roseobacter sp.]